VPVVFVTAFRERARPLVSSGTGIVDIIDKPFRVEQITDRLELMLAASKAGSTGASFAPTGG
jgi:DNA-binding response OmpR family regulator